jgi:hypothetical protein
MELFDFISVAVSIVLGISAAHLLSGLRDVVSPARRDWLVVSWYAYLMYLHLLTWWSLFAARHVLTWNLGFFTLAMAVPGFLYLATSTLLSEAPSAVSSWREHFQKVRPWFFVFYALFIATAGLRETLLLARPLLGITSGADMISIVNATAGAIWSSRKVQIAVITIEVVVALLVSAERFYGARG